MNKTFFALALPLLLALSPTSVFAARTLWVTIDGNAMVYDMAGNELENVSKYRFQSSGKVLNAAKVSVEDMNGGSSTYLLMVYDDPDTGRPVADDPDVQMIELPFGSESGGGTGTGTGTEPELTSSWLAFCLPDAYDNAEDPSVQGKKVTLELGYFNWDNCDTDPTGVTFERLAFAESSIGKLQTAFNVSPLASTAPAGQKPWTPMEFTAVPEPGTVGTALLGAALLLKRRRKAAAAAAAA